jgi:hypothetical protein
MTPNIKKKHKLKCQDPCRVVEICKKQWKLKIETPIAALLHNLFSLYFFPVVDLLLFLLCSGWVVCSIHPEISSLHRTRT